VYVLRCVRLFCSCHSSAEEIVDHVEIIFPSKSNLAEIASRVLTFVRDGWGVIKWYVTDFNRHCIKPFEPVNGLYPAGHFPHTHCVWCVKEPGSVVGRRV